MAGASTKTQRTIGAASLVVTAAFAACAPARLDLLGPGSEAANDGGTPSDGAMVTDAGGTPVDYCSGSGPPILVGATTTCAGGLAQSVFRYALCTCEGLVTAKPFVTDSFDGTAGPYDPASAGIGGSVGTNGSFDANADFTVGGALWSAATTTLTASAATVTKGELHVNSRVAGGTLLSVGADAFVNGDVLTQGDLTITGTLHQPAGATANAGGKKAIGATSTGPVSVPSACDCDPALRVDVAGFVEGYRTTNDDAATGVDPKALENVTADLTMTLPCGRIFFTRVGGTGKIHLTLAAGRTAIFIGGDLSPHGDFTIDVAPKSELDLFVEGGVVAAGAFMLGSAANPSNARLYVGGNGTINLAQATTLAGNVYGPEAELVLGGDTTVFGSIFTRRVSTQGALTIHYDESVLRKGDACSPTTSCTSCHDCGNQACNAGSCGTCKDSSDCCAPLQCQGGTCVPQLK